jgi:hypothetical protein
MYDMVWTFVHGDYGWQGRSTLSDGDEKVASTVWCSTFEGMILKIEENRWEVDEKGESYE